MKDMQRVRRSLNLGDCSEVVGVLSEVVSDSDDVTLVFSIFTEVAVPLDAVDVVQLKALVGRRIGVFRVGDSFKVRKIVRKDL